MRERRIDIKYRIGIDEDSYLLLRDEKKKQELSMAEIVCNLIKNKYGNIQTKPTTRVNRKLAK